MENLSEKLSEVMPYKWRIQSTKFSKASCVAYIDARDVMAKLDKVVGAANWQDDYKQVKNNLYAGVGIKVDGEWVWKWDCGTESNIEKAKGESSDSFKRAAVKWGIGRFLYALPVQQLKCAKWEKNGKEYPVDYQNNLIFNGKALTDFINMTLSNSPAKKPAPQPVKSKVKKLPTLTKKHEYWNRFVKALKSESQNIEELMKHAIISPELIQELCKESKTIVPDHLKLVAAK